MRNIALFCLMMAFLFSCEQESIREPVPGEFFPIKSIQYEDGLRDRSWTETFSYDDSKLLLRVDENYSFDNYKTFHYDNSKNVETVSYFVLEGNEIYEMDSVSYNTDGTIDKIYKFSWYPSPKSLKYILQYTYDSQGKVFSSQIISSSSVPLGITQYSWENGNIVRTENYSSEGTLEHVWTSSFDDARNFKYGNPYFLWDQSALSKSNVVNSAVTDYTDHLDLICYTCLTEYKYNTQLLPEVVEFDWGLKLQIRY